ncbi:futalosine hydrolase [Streptomyces sp. Ncost-T10-10d]|uniref:futalosine hydrolase n=1 Tax=Streptomyces sp. Ncost-T10-10d TaxID=1839774 RepID=UPI00081DA6AF|nr:futalosine hydrolase [Streptomyces sp. Ncost-T10-10d]SCF94539.1 futalosine hydrolase [Streptomyces sp. Ncost-T10-10d]
MRVLVVTAVPAERDAVTRAFGDVSEVAAREVPGARLHRVDAPGGRNVVVDVLAGGAGPAAAAAATAFGLASGPYDLVVSAGIGGGFAPVAPVGSLVVARRIVAADLGAETPEGFVPVTALGFGRDRYLPPRSLVRDVAAATGALTGEILTVSTVTGSAERAAALLSAHPRAAAEAMEGFGVAEAAERTGVPVLELRAVSNAVGPRDRDAWRIGDALAALTGAFGKLIPVLEGWTHHERNDS